MATWRELKAQGVRRCNAMFKDGTQCRRRAVSEWDNSWCAKHGPIIKMHTDSANAAIKAQLKSDNDGDDNEF